MNTHDIDIELPPLPKFDRLSSMHADDVARLLSGYGRKCARAAIEADRKRRGEPVAFVPVHPRNGPLWSDTYQAGTDADGRPQRYERMPLYTAPQPAEPHPPHRDCMCAECAPSFEDYSAEPREVQPVDIDKRNATVTLHFESAEAASRWFGRANNKIALRENAEPVRPWAPEKCPITGRPFFMWIEHHETGEMVPTYGGPYDSYTIPERDSDGSLSCERYDHDEGRWIVDCSEATGLMLVDDQSLVVSIDNPHYSEIMALTESEPVKVPSVPQHITELISAYGDARADGDDFKSGSLIGDAIRAIRAEFARYGQPSQPSARVEKTKVTSGFPASFFADADELADQINELLREVANGDRKPEKIPIVPIMRAAATIKAVVSRYGNNPGAAHE